MNALLHDMVEITGEMKIDGLLPAFSRIKHEVLIGRPNQECASCSKVFNAARKRRGIIRLYPPDMLVPVILQFHICGRCRDLYRQGGDAHAGVMVAVRAYCQGGDGHER